MTQATPISPRKKRRSALKRQRRAVLISLLVVAILGTTLGFVWHFTSRTVFEDLDGAKYYIYLKDGTYTMEDADGNTLYVTEDGNFVTALGTVVDVNEATGDPIVIAAVDRVNGEELKFNASSSEFDILMYPMLERANIKSIEIYNETDSFAFVRNAKDNFEIKGHPGITFDATMFATLVVCTGYTRTLMRLDTQKVLEYGYAEYGLPETLADAKNYYVITAMDGTVHTVMIGDEILSGAGYYARYDGRAEVYVMKELAESDTNATLSQVLLGKLETFVDPMVMVPMSSTNYFDVTNFGVFYASGLSTDPESSDFWRDRVVFSYIPIELRRGTYEASYPYECQSTSLQGFDIDTYRADDCLQNLCYMTALRTVVLNPTDADMEEYGLGANVAYALKYTFNAKRGGASQDYAPSESYNENIYISAMTEEGTHYMYNGRFHMIIEVSAEHLEFLEWTTFDWISSDIFGGNIAFMETLELTANGQKISFSLDNSATEQDENKGTVSSDAIKVFGTYGSNVNAPIDVKLFREFYKTLLNSSLVGEAPLTEAEQQALRDSGDAGADMVLRVVFNTGSKTEELIYRCYHYGDAGRQSFVTINGNGSFYMLQSRVNKIISDCNKVINGDTTIDSTAKN